MRAYPHPVCPPAAITFGGDAVSANTEPRRRWTCGEADLIRELGLEPVDVVGYPRCFGARKCVELKRAGVAPAQSLIQEQA